MPFDVVGFYESQQATALSGVAAVADTAYRTSGDDLYVQAKAPFLAAILQLGVSTPKYCEIRQPSLKTPYRTYRSGLIGTIEDVISGFHNLFSSPLPLYPEEKLNVYLQNASNEVSLVALWLSSGMARIADMEAVNPTHLITGYADATLTAGVWNDVTPTWDQDLPKGKYAVVGMEVGTYKASGPAYGVARLNLLPDSIWRPGVLLSALTGDKTIMASPDIDQFSVAKRWPLMPDVSFRHDNMPKLQMLVGDANTDHVVNLLIQKIE